MRGRGVGSTFYLYWDTLTILLLRMYMYQNSFAFTTRPRPTQSHPSRFPATLVVNPHCPVAAHTRETHPEIAFTLLGKSHRKFRHGNTPRKPTRMAIRFVFGSANNLYKWRREWTTCKTVNGSVNTSTNDRVTPVKVPKCGGLELV